MDQVKVILGYMRKYHFWILCVVAILASVVGSMMAGGALSEEFTKGESAVKSKFSSLQQIQTNPNPPNSTWTTEIEKLTQEERQKVAAAWQGVYDEQQKVLQWPGEDLLGGPFHRFITTSPPNADIPPNWCTHYRNQVANQEFRKLPEIVDAKLELEEDARGNAAAAPPPVDDGRTYSVVWDEGSQQEVKQSMEMANVGTPSSLEVRLKQEDLWVYRALLTILKNTNASAEYTPYVKQIDRILIGREAAKLFQDGMKPGHIERIVVEGAPADIAQPAAQAPENNGPQPPDEGRYVSADGRPQPSGSWQTEQVKRMPIYMRLVMDQRQLPLLLSECANSPLPVEVSQLRINPDSQTTSSSKAATTSIYDVTVEIHGIVSIYNPPDPAALGLPAEGTATAAM